MNRKKRLCLMGMFLGVLFLSSQGWAGPKPESKGPHVTHVYAIEKRWGGPIWKIFMEANSPDVQMAKIGVTVDQPGYGSYPTEWIPVKSQYGHTLKGYLQWNVDNSRDKFQIVLKVFVVDKTGTISNEVVLPLTIESRARVDHSRPGALLDQDKLPAPFDEGDVPRLGYINIELVSSEGG